MLNEMTNSWSGSVLDINRRKNTSHQALDCINIQALFYTTYRSLYLEE